MWRLSCAGLAACALLLALAPTTARGQEGHAAPAPGPAVSAPAPVTGVIGRLIDQAQPGDVILVPPGVHFERVRIDRPITLEGRGRAVIDGGGGGDIVEIAAPDVALRGFTIRNTGTDLDHENAAVRVLAPRATIEDNTLEDVLFGIDLRGAPSSVVRNNRIGGKALDIARRGDGLRLWRSDGSVVEGNTLMDGRDAVLWYSKGLVVRGNRAERCRYGLHLMYADEVVVEDNRFEGNSVGVYIMYSAGVRMEGNLLLNNRGPSGYGLGLKEADRYTIQGNTLAGNRVGVYIDGSPFSRTGPGEIVGNAVVRNDVGLLALPSSTGGVVAGNDFIDNIQQAAVAGRGAIGGNRFDRDGRGNFWSDYTGFDADADGLGDFVHEPGTLFDGILARHPSLRLFLYSPAQQAVELVGRALPAVRPEPMFMDEWPLMRPAGAGAAPPPESGRRAGMGAVGALLASLGAGVGWLARRGGGAP